MQKKYFINTYGCQMNVHESEKLAGILKECDYCPSESIENADLILFNTCCIRETAETKIIGNIGAVKNLKIKKPSLKIVVCGCMTQKDTTAEILIKKFPFIDIIFGTYNIHMLKNYLNSNDKKVLEVWKDEPQIIEDMPVFRTSGFNAWVNIMYGCNNFCSYCIVPYVRGRERSRQLDSIMSDIVQLISQGYKEITLLGQNVNSYGNDLNNNTCSFPKLLEQIDKLSGDFKVKFMTSHPKDISIELIEVIAKSNKLAHYIHLPIQSGSDKVLNAMNRKYTAEDYISKINFIRSLLPDVGLSTDIMVGFPGETAQDFADTISMIEKVKFNNIFPFIYSKRSGTAAATMENQISKVVKTERIKEIISLQKSISKTNSSNMLGKTLKVLCVEKVDDKIISKSNCEKVVILSNGTEENLGTFVNVEILSSKNSKLIGRIV